MSDEPILTGLPSQPDLRVSEIGSVLILMHELKLDFASRMNNFEASLKEHMTDESLELAESVHTAMTRAFPNADAESHKAYHELLMRKMEAQTRLREKLVEEITRWGIIGILGFVAYSTWIMFLKGPMK